MLWRRRIRSRRIREERRQRFMMSSLVWLAVVLAFGLLSVQISILPQFRVERVEILGNKAESGRALYRAIADEFVGRYLFLFPKNNVLLFSRRSIESLLLEEFPRLMSADVRAVSLQDIEINVVEREMVGVVCHPADVAEVNEVTGENTEEKCLFLDDSGFIFATAPTFSGDGYFRYYDVSRRKLSIGTFFLPETEFRQLLQLQKVLEQLAVVPIALTVGGNKNDKFARYFAFELKGVTQLIFSTEQSELEEQVQNLQAVLTSEVYAEESGGDIGAIEYIDLRFGSKVFYRIRE